MTQISTPSRQGANSWWLIVKDSLEGRDTFSINSNKEEGKRAWRRSEGRKWNVKGEEDERLNVFELLSFNFFWVNTVVFMSVDLIFPSSTRGNQLFFHTLHKNLCIFASHFLTLWFNLLENTSMGLKFCQLHHYFTTVITVSLMPNKALLISICFLSKCTSLSIF